MVIHIALMLTNTSAKPAKTPRRKYYINSQHHYMQPPLDIEHINYINTWVQLFTNLYFSVAHLLGEGTKHDDKLVNINIALHGSFLYNNCIVSHRNFSMSTCFNSSFYHPAETKMKDNFLQIEA